MGRGQRIGSMGQALLLPTAASSRRRHRRPGRPRRSPRCPRTGSPNPVVAAWILDKRDLIHSEEQLYGGGGGGLGHGGSLARPAQRRLESFLDQARKDVQALARLKHPGVLRLVAPLEETRTQLVLITEPVFASLADLLGAAASHLPPVLASERRQLRLSGAWHCRGRMAASRRCCCCVGQWARSLGITPPPPPPHPALVCLPRRARDQAWAAAAGRRPALSALRGRAGTQERVPVQPAHHRSGCACMCGVAALRAGVRDLTHMPLPPVPAHARSPMLPQARGSWRGLDSRLPRTFRLPRVRAHLITARGIPRFCSRLRRQVWESPAACPHASPAHAPPQQHRPPPAVRPAPPARSRRCRTSHRSWWRAAAQA